jgi:hypothetical protein
MDRLFLVLDLEELMTLKFLPSLGDARDEMSPQTKCGKFNKTCQYIFVVSTNKAEGAPPGLVPAIGDITYYAPSETWLFSTRLSAIRAD